MKLGQEHNPLQCGRQEEKRKEQRARRLSTSVLFRNAHTNKNRCSFILWYLHKLLHNRVANRLAANSPPIRVIHNLNALHTRMDIYIYKTNINTHIKIFCFFFAFPRNTKVLALMPKRKQGCDLISMLMKIKKNERRTTNE